MQAALDFHFNELARPIPLYHLARNVSRKLAMLGLTGDDMLKLMPNVQLIPSGSGGKMVMPKDAWDALPYDRRLEWTGTTLKILEKLRQKDIQSARDYLDKGHAEARKLARMDGAQRSTTNTPSAPIPMEISKPTISETPTLEGHVIPQDPSDLYSSDTPDPFGINTGT